MHCLYWFSTTKFILFDHSSFTINSVNCLELTLSWKIFKQLWSPCWSSTRLSFDNDEFRADFLNVRRRNVRSASSSFCWKINKRICVSIGVRNCLYMKQLNWLWLVRSGVIQAHHAHCRAHIKPKTIKKNVLPTRYDRVLINGNYSTYHRIVIGHISENRTSWNITITLIQNRHFYYN